MEIQQFILEIDLPNMGDFCFQTLLPSYSYYVKYLIDHKCHFRKGLQWLRTYGEVLVPAYSRMSSMILENKQAKFHLFSERSVAWYIIQSGPFNFRLGIFLCGGDPRSSSWSLSTKYVTVSLDLCSLSSSYASMQSYPPEIHKHRKICYSEICESVIHLIAQPLPGPFWCAGTGKLIRARWIRICSGGKANLGKVNFSS